MASLSDYLVWRGDITFEQVPLTVVDALLLSQLSYLDLTGVIGENEKRKECTLLQASERYWKLHTEKELSLSVSFALKTAGLLLRKMAKTKRFANLVLRNYVRRIDAVAEEQFEALEVVLGKRESFISYGGTDDTLVGWKEDFNMCFLSPIPAQTDALLYLERVLDDSLRKVYLGGHSKGGNLSVYAAVKCKKLASRRILNVYNFDGPGFTRSFIENSRYLDMKDKIETWVPESSIIGMLLEHEEDYQVVESNHVGILQHDVTSWEVQGAEFVKLPDVKVGSKRLAVGVKEWLSGLQPEELEYFCDCIFDVLTATDAKTLAELNKDRWKSITGIIRSYNAMDKKAKDMLFALLKAMVATNMKMELPKRADLKTEKKTERREAPVSVGRKKLPENQH